MEIAMRRGRRADPQKDEAILEAATALFLERGYGASIDDIAAAAGVSKQTIYARYACKHDLLAAIARQNIERFPAELRRCDQLSVLTADATNFALPAGPLALYLYNPFHGPVMRQVAEHVGHALAAEPRRVIVIYFNPVCAAEWDRLTGLQRVQSGPWLNIYDSQPDKRHL